MMGVVEKLQKVGLTEYEAKAYVGLLSDHLSTATNLSEKSGVPRTRIYSVLESLANKGWIRIYSGIPLLFKAVDPHNVFDRIKEDYTEFMGSVEATLNMAVDEVKEKFIIKKSDVGLRNLKEKTVIFTRPEILTPKKEHKPKKTSPLVNLPEYKPRKKKTPSLTRIAIAQARLKNISRRKASIRKYRGKFRPKSAYEKRLWKPDEKP